MADSASFAITDNSDKVLDALEEQVLHALEACGQQAEKYAKLLAPVDTGNLRNSITHTVVPAEHTVYIGTNVEYAIYQEMGTGKFADGGRKTPWSYQDKEGNWRRTEGARAQPFLRPAIADHAGDYRTTIERTLKGG